MSVRAVLFDIGNTLLEYSLDGHWREFRIERMEEMYPLVSELLGPVAVPPTEFALTVGEVIGGESARAIERAGRSWHFVERLRAGLASVGLRAGEHALDQLTDAFYEPIRDCTKAYPDTREALGALRSRGIRMAIITNSPWDTPGRLLRGDLEHWGIADFFGAFVCSGDVPWRKPDPLFMLAAAEALGVSPAECLVVGDRREVDIAGAAAAGMKSVWLNRGEQAVSADAPQPDFTGTTLAEVIATLAKVGG